MMERKRLDKTILLNGVVILACFFAVFPVYIMVTGALKDSKELYSNAYGFPVQATLDNFSRLLNYNSGLIVRTFGNSIFVATCYTALSCLLASMAGYAFAKFGFKGKNVLFLFLIVTMMIPAELNITPLYLIFSKMKWLNTYQVQIIPGAANVFALFLMRQYMMSIPDSLLEAARIDGAGDWRIFTKIVLPISSPSIGALAILQFLSKWNELLYPKIMLTSSREYHVM